VKHADDSLNNSRNLSVASSEARPSKLPILKIRELWAASQRGPLGMLQFPVFGWGRLIPTVDGDASSRLVRAGSRLGRALRELDKLSGYPVPFQLRYVVDE